MDFPTLLTIIIIADLAILLVAWIELTDDSNKDKVHGRFDGWWKL